MKVLWRTCAALAGALTLSQIGWTQSFPQRKLAAVPEIGSLMSASEKDTRTECMVNSAQFDPCVEATIGGVKYSIAFRKGTGIAIS